MRGLFVTGTDTGVGKSVVAAAICAALVARGERVAAFKPVVTGLDEPPGDWPHDHELLAAAPAGQAAGRGGALPVRPAGVAALAAELAGAGDRAGARWWRRARARPDADVLVGEGVGGLLVPLTPGYLVRDLAVDLGLPVVIAARTGLGTINHTLLTVEAARAAGLDGGGRGDDALARTSPSRSSARTARPSSGSAGVPVSGLPRDRRPRRWRTAGAALPLGDWL